MTHRGIADFATKFLLIMLVLVLSASYICAQNSTGEIDGTVTDSTNAVIPNASVILTNTDQNAVVRTLKTDGQGQFVAAQLATGHYLLTIKASGFQKLVEHGIEVHVNQQTAVHVVLQPGETSETITVSAAPLAPETQSPAAGTLIGGSQVEQLSLAGRNYESLLSLQPGVSGDIPASINRGHFSSTGSTNNADFQVNGQRTSQNGYYLDGADILNHGSSTQASMFPSIDAIQEMNLLRNSYGAQYGGSGSAIIAMQTRSGTTVFHGDAFEFFRSQILNANNYFNNLAHVARPGIRMNDYGYSLGGPVWIPHRTDVHNTKTFFFILQELLRSETQSTETLSNIPTQAQRQGIFAAPVCVAYSGSTCTQSATSITNIDPTAQTYLKDILNKTPLPNNPNDPQGLIASETGISNETQTVIRIDHRFDQRLSIFFRYLNDPFHLLVPNGVFGSSGIPGVATSTIFNSGTSYLGHVTFVLDSTTVIDGGYAYTPSSSTAKAIGLIAESNSPDIQPTLPYVSTVDRVPSLSIDGRSYSATSPYDNPAHYHQVFVNVTHTSGRHTFYMGGVFESMSSSSDSGSTNGGVFTFGATAVPSGSSASQFMQSFANFLEGRVSTFSQTSINAAGSVNSNLYEGYFQDDFRASTRLTLNGGVRYTLVQTPYAGPFLGASTIPFTNFVPSQYNAANAPTIGSNGLICTASPCPGGAAPNSAYNPLNGIIIAGKTSPYGNAVASQPKLDFAPRAGFAWDVRENGTTSLRGGYGIYYIQNNLGPFQAAAHVNPPFITTTTIPNTSFDSPGNGIPVASSSPLVMTASQEETIQPYSQDWSLDLQQQAGKSILVDIGYYGDRGTHLLGEEDINQPLPGAYVQDGVIPGNKITASNTAMLNRIRPFLGFGVIPMYGPMFTSNYHSLQTSLAKRFRDGSIVNVDYTWSKALTNSQSDSGKGPQSIYDLRTEYGRAAFNRTSVFSANVVYNLPFFRSQHGLVGYALGGWETTAIIGYASGLPLSAASKNVDPAGLGLLASGTPAQARPDQIANPNNSAPHHLKQWFNTAAFAQVPAGEYRPGNAHVNSITGPGYEVWNLSIFKNIAIRDQAKMQFRVESFNTLNHTNFSGVAATLAQSNYGQVTSSGEARVVQLAAKITF